MTEFWLCLSPAFSKKSVGTFFASPFFRPSVCPSVCPPIEVGTYNFIPILLKLHWCFGYGLRYACGLDIILRLFLLRFSQVELSHFSGIIYNNVNGQGIPCGRDSSYSFLPILLKLHWCFGHGLKICMWFGYNPQNIFVTFFESRT